MVYTLNDTDHHKDTILRFKKKLMMTKGIKQCLTSLDYIIV